MKHKFSAAAALAYALEHASGKNEEAIGAERASMGNSTGAARLCAWAIARKVQGPGGRAWPVDAIKVFRDLVTERLHIRCNPSVDYALGRCAPCEHHAECARVRGGK